MTGDISIKLHWKDDNGHEYLSEALGFDEVLHVLSALAAGETGTFEETGAGPEDDPRCVSTHYCSHDMHRIKGDE